LQGSKKFFLNFLRIKDRQPVEKWCPGDMVLLGFANLAVQGIFSRKSPERRGLRTDIGYRPKLGNSFESLFRSL